jgi:hypothetical protein
LNNSCRILDKIIDSVHKKLLDAEETDHRRSITKQNNQQDKEQERRRQSILEIGKLTAEYEDNFTFLTNMQHDDIPNNRNIILQPEHPKYFCGQKEDSEYYHLVENRTRKEIQEYENKLAKATESAAKAGCLVVNPKQEMEQFSQYCKQFYFAKLAKEERYKKGIKTIIGSNGIITVVNENTNEVKKYDRAFNPL